LAAPDPDDESDTRRVLAVVKSNLAAIPSALAYHLAPDDRLGCARFEWDGPTGHRADDLLVTPEVERAAPKRDAGRSLLEEMLADGSRLRSELEAAATAREIGWRTVERAATELGVVREQYHEEGRRGAGPAYWRLPNADIRSAIGGDRPDGGPNTEAGTLEKQRGSPPAAIRSATNLVTWRTKPEAAPPIVHRCDQCGSPDGRLTIDGPLCASCARRVIHGVPNDHGA